MGGLVARNLIRMQPKLWDEMQGTDLVAGGRLIMLGTPNYGSFAIPPVFTGSDQMMDLLAKLDLKHNMAELLDITNTFPGSYMLLPAPSKLSGALQGLYQRDTWGGTPNISQTHLSRTYQFFQDLDAGPTIDPRRMAYVAGCRRATFTGMTIVAPGEFEYKLSYDGDGRVPHDLGLLEGVRLTSSMKPMVISRATSRCCAQWTKFWRQAPPTNCQPLSCVHRFALCQRCVIIARPLICDSWTNSRGSPTKRSRMADPKV